MARMQFLWVLALAARTTISTTPAGAQSATGARRRIRLEPLP
jgi:hypothetical protein